VVRPRIQAYQPIDVHFKNFKKQTEGGTVAHSYRRRQRICQTWYSLTLLPCAPWVVCGEAEDGAECLRKASDLRPDLILLDLVMPGLSGLSVATVLRRNLPRTKVLLVSAQDSEILLPTAILAGANGCIDKGRMGTELIAAITRISDA
jgi:CheY-like chemotaxis protein